MCHIRGTMPLCADLNFDSGHRSIKGHSTAVVVPFCPETASAVKRPLVAIISPRVYGRRNRGLMARRQIQPRKLEGPSVRKSLPTWAYFMRADDGNRTRAFSLGSCASGEARCCRRPTRPRAQRGQTTGNSGWSMAAPAGSSASRPVKGGEVRHAVAGESRHRLIISLHKLHGRALARPRRAVLSGACAVIMGTQPRRRCRCRAPRRGRPLTR